MHIFMTGASGWIGSAVVPELLAAGHQVRGIARSAMSAARLRAAGVDVVEADLDNLDVLGAQAERADAVLHLANKHDWSNPAESNRAERASVQTFLTALEGSGKPFLLAAGTARPIGRPLTELDDNPFSAADSPRGGSEGLAMSYADRGVRAVSLRFAPTVHGTGGDHGFISLIARAARERGASAYVGDGTNRWTAVNRLDAARLVALALARAEAGTAVHAVAEEAVTSRSIAEAVGAALGVPVISVPAEGAVEHFGWIGNFFALDMPASAQLTRERFGWEPTHPSLAEDIAAGAYTV
ncbi:MAG TPA: NAD-dependent epimerase/dehydratase family protein [Propionicimonas sp.]|jgi:nucleoside-diphosphate-sugar epimerase|uniref:NAD-dependent epimerase/dehydratase family protein n=1 Tax=Propionicimonas sp. TaxID=1955623 RepID=UPI002F4223AE